MKKKLLLTALLGIAFNLTQAQGPTKYKVYSGFMNYFTKYVQWPADSKSDEFVIAVVGNSPLASELQPLAGKMVGTKKIVVKSFANASAVNVGQIIFISEDQSSAISAISTKAKQYNSLVVTETPGGTGKGSDVNFIEQDGKVRFELSANNSDAHGIKVSAELKKLGISM